MTSQGPWSICVHRWFALALALCALGGGVQPDIQNSGGGKWGMFNGDGAPPPT
jgi:hypothetical protein